MRISSVRSPESLITSRNASVSAHVSFAGNNTDSSITWLSVVTVAGADSTAAVRQVQHGFDAAGLQAYLEALPSTR